MAFCIVMLYWKLRNRCCELHPNPQMLNFALNHQPRIRVFYLFLYFCNKCVNFTVIQQKYWTNLESNELHWNLQDCWIALELIQLIRLCIKWNIQILRETRLVFLAYIFVCLMNYTGEQTKLSYLVNEFPLQQSERIQSKGIC